jgi:hypothetical protein
VRRLLYRIDKCFLTFFLADVFCDQIKDNNFWSSTLISLLLQLMPLYYLRYFRNVYPFPVLFVNENVQITMSKYVQMQIYVAMQN